MSDDIKTRLAAIEDRLARGEERAEAMEAALQKNTAATLEGSRDTREILETFQALRGGFKVLGWLGTAAKWVAGIAAAVSALWVLFHQIYGPKP